MENHTDAVGHRMVHGGEEVILSDKGSKVVTMVVPTDEEMAIAEETKRLLS